MESRLREKFSELKPGAAVPPKIGDVIGALMSEKCAFNFCDTTTTSGRDYRRGIHYNSHYAHRRGRQNCSPCLCFLPHPSQNGVFLSFVKSFEIRGVCIFSRLDASARFALKALAFPPLVWYSISALGYWREVDIWLLQSENPLRNSALCWGCSFLPAFFASWIAWPRRCPLPLAFC